MRSHVLLMVEAQTKTTFAEYTVEAPVAASIARTPVARLRLASYTTSVTIWKVLSIKRPVATAAGSVDDCVLK
jgi:hypothetical protein